MSESIDDSGRVGRLCNQRLFSMHSRWQPERRTGKPSASERHSLYLRHGTNWSLTGTIQGRIGNRGL
jgi:hypothetical protein